MTQPKVLSMKAFDKGEIITTVAATECITMDLPDGAKIYAVPMEALMPPFVMEKHPELKSQYSPVLHLREQKPLWIMMKAGTPDAAIDRGVAFLAQAALLPDPLRAAMLMARSKELESLESLESAPVERVQ